MKILCIGDSNTYGYDPRSYFGSRYPEDVRWTDRLNGCDVINAGANGMKVPRNHSVYADIIRNSGPDLVIVMLGTNDICAGAGAERTTDRMEAFLDHIMGAGKPVLLISPPVLQPGDWVMSGDLIEESLELGELYRELARRKGCMFADSGEWGVDVTFDGVHFSPEGHAAFARELEKVLQNCMGTGFCR